MSRALAAILVFVTSASVLVLEILAGRLLAPYAGVTLETFTAIIGVVLAGIAVGTWLGGRLADSGREPAALLGPTMVIGGALAATSVPIVRALGPSMGRAGIPGLVILTGISMLPATAVLSAVSPIVVKTMLSDLNETGTTVGRFSALGTFGALVGTFTSGFLLVASFRTPVIILSVAAMVAALGVAVSFRFGRQARAALLFGALGLGSGVLTLVLASPCDTETAYYCASAVADPERPGSSFLVLDTVTHAYVDPEDPTYLRFTSTRMFAAAIEAMTEGRLDALHIGGGGLTIPGWLSETRPGSTNVVLELDPALMDFVEETYEPAPIDTLLIGDARTSLPDVGSGFDVAVGDAFGGLAVPWHLTTVEFISEVADSLKDDGFYIMNVIDHGSFDFLRAELATTQAIFPFAAVVTVPERLELGGNFMIVGSFRPIPTEDILTEAGLLDLELLALTGSDLAAFIDNARILTDDYAPVDQLLEIRS